MAYNDIRTDQINDARRTLSVRPDARRTEPRRTDAPRRAHVAKGHDAILKQLQDDKSQVRVMTIAGETVTGTIAGRDKFTITINEESTVIGAMPEPVTLYKHAIESFRKVA
jgi:sRNA-binding regulator protein Hfq